MNCAVTKPILLPRAPAARKVRSRFPATPLPRTKIEEYHSEEDQCEVEGFAAEVLFLEDEGGEEEADYDAAAADHGDYGNHRAGH